MHRTRAAPKSVQFKLILVFRFLGFLFFVHVMCTKKSGKMRFFFFFFSFLFWKREDEILVTHWPDPHISLRLTTAWQVLEQVRAIKEATAFSFHLNWNENSLSKREKKRKEKKNWNERNTERRVTSLKLFCFFLWVRLFCFCYQNFFFLVKVILFLFLKHQMLTQRLKKKWYSPIGY